MIALVLASGSPRRYALLSALGTEVSVVVSGVPETATGSPQEVCIGNACLKRDDVVNKITPPSIVVAADTIVVLGDRVMGKPRDLDEARAMLRDLSGRTHVVMTGVAVIHTQTNTALAEVEETRVTFRDLSDEDIDRFVVAVNPVDRAGAYTVDGPGSLLVARYDGCYQNVLGLPMVRLDAMLTRLDSGLFARIDARSARFL